MSRDRADNWKDIALFLGEQLGLRHEALSRCAMFMRDWKNYAEFQYGHAIDEITPLIDRPFSLSKFVKDLHADHDCDPGPCKCACGCQSQVSCRVLFGPVCTDCYMNEIRDRDDNCYLRD